MNTSQVLNPDTRFETSYLRTVIAGPTRSLTGIPSKLRLMIFKYLITPDHGINSFRWQPWTPSPYLQVVAYKPSNNGPIYYERDEVFSLAFLRTCKVIYNDCRDLLWSYPIEITHICPGRYIPKGLMVSMYEQVLGRLQIVHLRVGGQTTESLKRDLEELEKMPKLKEVVLVIEERLNCAAFDRLFLEGKLNKQFPLEHNADAEHERILDILKVAAKALSTKKRKVVSCIADGFVRSQANFNYRLARPNYFALEQILPTLDAFWQIGIAFNCEVWVDGIKLCADRSLNLEHQSFGAANEVYWKPFERYFWSSMAAIHFYCMDWKKAMKMTDCLIEGHRWVPGSGVGYKAVREQVLDFFTSKQSVRDFKRWRDEVNNRGLDDSMPLAVDFYFFEKDWSPEW